MIRNREFGITNDFSAVPIQLASHLQLRAQRCFNNRLIISLGDDDDDDGAAGGGQ